MPHCSADGTFNDGSLSNDVWFFFWACRKRHPVATGSLARRKLCHHRRGGHGGSWDRLGTTSWFSTAGSTAGCRHSLLQVAHSSRWPPACSAAPGASTCAHYGSHALLLCGGEPGESSLGMMIICEGSELCRRSKRPAHQLGLGTCFSCQSDHGSISLQLKRESQVQM